MPKSIIFFSHTENSKKKYPGGIGEIINTKKIYDLARSLGYPISEIIDIYELFEDPQWHQALFEANYTLAEQGYPVIEEVGCTQLKSIYHQIASKKPSILMWLTWNRHISALLALGLHRLCATIGKLYAFWENERIFNELYNPLDLLLTESLLGNKKGIQYGIPPWKILYLPHHYPANIEDVKPDPFYIQHFLQKKEGLLKRNAPLIIGMVCRLEPGKNIGFALDVVHRLVQEGKNILFVLKGTFHRFDHSSQRFMESLQKQDWFVWDSEYTPFPEVLNIYATFDLCLNLSGSEGASNVIVEFLALGKPTLILQASTNGYLFKGGAYFIKNDGQLRSGPTPYIGPDDNDLYMTLKAFIEDESLRKEWGIRAKEIAKKRFHPSINQERIPLLFEAASSFRLGQTYLREKILSIYEEDCKNYQI
jgi:glycosyltransferase involved in cell wall biosynthesis